MVFNLLLLLLLITSKLSCIHADAKLGQGAIQRDRIIHGIEVDIMMYPYQVALVNKHNHIICGGVLVVFTAAHCTHIDDTRRRRLRVLAGANYVRDPLGRFYEILRVHRHPGFFHGGFDNDFSVIVLVETVQFNARVQPIPIGVGNFTGGTIATASGWGKTETGKQAKYLRAANLTIDWWDRCQDHFPKCNHPRITKNMLCVRPGFKTTYYGDSGGPLVVDGELVGLVSFGRKVGHKKKATVFTNVQNFLDYAGNVAPEFFQSLAADGDDNDYYDD